ncbi:hypothetical protein [Salinarimonas rosea]|uniref:baeRF3 domain-containing protein n=1 Tax=Salinarimonas rosea TaxID=552063 RepID=UPI000416A6E4|nr:hypothetical protein [Salinarimonas rosea]
MLHLDPVTEDDLRRLDAQRGTPCVTLTMPTQPATIPSLREDTLALRDLREEAVRRLEAAGLDKAAIADIDERLRALEEDGTFWKWVANGLVVFVKPGMLRTVRLPETLARRIEISDRFHIKPLAPLLTNRHDAYVLELEQRRVRLLRVDEGQVTEVEDTGLPKDLDDFVEHERTPENTVTSGIQQSSEKKIRQRQFAHHVEQVMRRVLQGRRTPLVLAGVESILGFYREVNTYPHLAEEAIAGNQSRTGDEEIAERARAIVDARFDRALAEALARVDELRNVGKGSSDLSEIARAAEEGRVDTLVVSLDETVYGRLEDGIGSFVPGEEASVATYDVLDEIVGRTVRTGGRVLAAHADRLPEGLKAAATFRYAA